MKKRGDLCHAAIRKKKTIWQTKMSCYSNDSPWKDFDDNAESEVFLEYDDYVTLGNNQYLCHFIERNWNILGLTEQENLDLGRLCLIDAFVYNKEIFTKNNHAFYLYGHGKTFEDALVALERGYNFGKRTIDWIP